MTKLCPINVHVQKWHLAYFVPIYGHFGKLLDMDFKWTNFEVNQTQIGHSIPKNTPKNH